MKPQLILVSIFLVMGCVSKQKYSDLQNEILQIKANQKVLKNELKSYQARNKNIEDSIRITHELALLEITRIKNRLKLKKINIDVNGLDLGGLSIRNQDFSDEYYEKLRLKQDFKDTNSAKNTKWMSKNEINLVYWLNRARLNPTQFCMQYIYPMYLESPKNVYIITLMDYMLHMKPVPALKPDKFLFESAFCHAKTTGIKGIIGHEREDGCKSRFNGECCSYGVYNPLEIVIQLLVDDGVTSLGHRYICLGSYSLVGISIQPHKGYGTNAVLDFGYNNYF